MIGGGLNGAAIMLSLLNTILLIIQESMVTSEEIYNDVYRAIENALKEINNFKDYYLNMPDEDLKLLRNNCAWAVAVLGVLAVIAVVPAVSAGFIVLTGAIVVVGYFLAILAALGSLFLLTDPYRWK